MPDQDDPEAHRRPTVALMNHGLVPAAITAQINCVNAGMRIGKRLAGDETLLVALILIHGEARSAVVFGQRVVEHWPDYPPDWGNLAYAYGQCGNAAAVKMAYRRVLDLLPDDINTMDGLARALGSQGRHNKAVDFGRQALEARDRVAAGKPKVWDIPTSLPPDGGTPTPKTHVIAHNLLGRHPALHPNDAAQRADRTRHLSIYPGWSCRIYHDDSVPEAVLPDLDEEGTVLVRAADRHLSKEG